jgi:hypothetical protein
VSEADRMCSNCSFWARKLLDRMADQPLLGECRRHPPAGGPRVAAADSAVKTGDTLQIERTGWPLTLDRDWCGEWVPTTSPPLEEPLNEEEDRQLRNAAIAQALLVLSPEKRDALLCAILTDEERACPTPPDDFFERVQTYLARQGEETTA